MLLTSEFFKRVDGSRKSYKCLGGKDNKEMQNRESNVSGDLC